MVIFMENDSLSLTYWTELMDNTQNLQMPIDYSRKYHEKNSSEYEEFIFSDELIGIIQDFSKKQDSSFSMILNTAFSVLMARYCNQTRIPIVNIVSVMDNAEDKFNEKRAIGYFIEISDKVNFVELVSEVAEKTKRLGGQFSLSIENYISMMNTRHKEKQAPMPPILTWIDDNYITEFKETNLSVAASKENNNLPVFDIMLQIIELNNKYKLFYDSQLFEKQTIKRIVLNFTTLLYNILQKPNDNILDIEYISLVEKNKILNDFNHKDIDYYTDLTIVDYFRKEILTIPDKVIAYEDGITITIEELDRKTSILAQKLIQSESKYVGLVTEKGISTIIGIFAILKSAKCVVAINSKYPKNRIEYIIKECGLDTIVTCEDCYEYMREVSKDIAELQNVIDADMEDNVVCDFNYELMTKPDDPSYVIYTSGTTGNPKGVIITHRNFMILFLWFTDYLGLDEDLRAYQNLSYSFDFGMFDILSCVLCGGTLFFNNKKKIGSLKAHVNYINEFKINNICTTPSFFSILSSFRISMPSLKILHLGGEKVTYKHLENFNNVLADTCNIYNGYGPSECTINNTIYQISTEDRYNMINQKRLSIPIGKPSANNYIYILDDYDQIVPIGAYGELCISGDGIGLGYLNNTALTKKKFQLNPINPEQMMYRSGDIVRWLSDGNIEFIERKDDQVKIIGYRIEVGEIETCLLNHPYINKAAVVVITNEISDQKYLVAFLETEMNLNDVRNYLLGYLPYYMIPKRFEIVNDMPLTYNGKIDKKKLAERYIK